MSRLLPPVAEAASVRRPPAGPLWQGVRRTAGAMRESKAAMFGAGLLTVHLILAVFGPGMGPYPYAAFHLGHMLEAPSRQFLAGTDQFGRDQLSRVRGGARR